MTKPTKRLSKTKTSPTPAARQTSPQLIAELDDPGSLARCVAMIADEGSLYWHDRIQRIFAAAGFETRRIEREEHHPVWQIWLTRETFNLAPDTDTVARQLRTVLCRGGLPIRSHELTVTDYRKNKLRAVFMFYCGSPGVWNGRPLPAKKQGELWPKPR